MTLFYDPTGPLVRYADGVLYIDDLNPQVSMRWRMSRMEMLSLGWRCIAAALSTRRGEDTMKIKTAPAETKDLGNVRLGGKSPSFGPARTGS